MLKRCLHLSLVLVAATAVRAQAQAGPEIRHDKLQCLVVGKFPKVEAQFVPPEVAQARVYFRPEGVPSWYYVEVVEGVGVLPKPTKKLVDKHVEYYLEAADRSFASGRTPEYDPIVVKDAEECKKRLLPVAPVSATGPVGLSAIPAGFAGGAAGVSTAAAVAGAAVAAGGATTAAVVAGEDKKQFPLQVSKVGSGASSGTVTSDPSGINCGGTCSASYEEGTRVTLRAEGSASAVSASSGQQAAAADTVFAGWEGDCAASGTGPCTLTMDSAKNVTARFASRLILTVSKTGGGAGTVSSQPGGIDCGSACSAAYEAGTQVVLRAVAAAGSTFAGWSGAGCSGTGTCTVTMDASKSVVANFTPVGIRLTVVKTGTGTGTVMSDPFGIDCGSRCTSSFDFGAVVTLSARPDPGSTFAGWSGEGCSGTGTCTVRMDAVKTVTASFTGQTRLSVRVLGGGKGTVTSVPAGIRCGSGQTGSCVATYNNGTIVELTATPEAGNVFTGWGGSCAGTVGNVCRLVMDQSHDATAAFEPAAPTTFQLTLTVKGPGSVSDNSGQIANCRDATCTATYAPNTPVTLTATEDFKIGIFIGWGGDCASRGNQTTCTLTMNQNHSAAANFGFNLSVFVSGRGSGTVTSSPPGINCGSDCDESYTAGTPVQLTATADPGSVFSGWTFGADGCTGTTSPCTVTVDRNEFLQADFDPLVTHTLTVDVQSTFSGCPGTVTSSSSEPGEPLINCSVPGNGSCSDQATYGDGRAVRLTADSPGCLIFWGGACSSASGTTCDLTMNADLSATVGFDTLGVKNKPAAPDALSRDSKDRRLNWIMLLEVPGGEGRVVFNGQHVTLAGAGASRAGVPGRPGDNRVEARLHKGEGRPGTWRFQLENRQELEPGSLRVVQGEPLSVLPDAIVFRLAGTPGEQVVFSFRLKR